MAPIVYKNRFTWKIEEFTRENIRERWGDYDFMEMDDYSIDPEFKSPTFAHNINGLDNKWKCSLLAPEEGYCEFKMYLIPEYVYLSGFKFTIDVSIQQSDGNVKKIDSINDLKYSDLPALADFEESYWNFLKIDEIFNTQNKYLDSDSTLTLIIDIKTSHKHYDGSLKSQCGIQLVDLITTENVIDMLYYADRCNLKNLEKKCLDFIYDNFEEVKENKAKWKNISTELMFKIMEKLRYPEEEDSDE